MSSHSPSIVSGVGGSVDTSAMFGKSILDVGVPYPADMAKLPTSTPNPGALKRKTRRSWFEATPSGSKIEIAVENENSKPVQKILKGEVEVLTLTHFTAAPRLDFGTMKPGQVKISTLLLRNPHEYEQAVKVERVPEKKHFTVDQKAFTVGSGETFPLEITWSPPEAGNFREMILIQVDKAYRLQAYVFGTVTAPPQKKKKRRVGLLATKVSKPFSVIQTSGLASISQQYSPEKKSRRSSGEVRKTNGTVRESNGALPKLGKTTRRSDEKVCRLRETKRRSAEKASRSVESTRRSTETLRVSGEATRMSGGAPRRSPRLSGQGLPVEENLKKANNDIAKCRNNLKKEKSRDNKENVENRIPKKKMRRSNTYSNVSNQGLVIPVIHGDTVQGQMDTSLLDIVDKCNVSGIVPLEQSFTLPDDQNYASSMKKAGGVTMFDKPSFLEEKTNVLPNMDEIVRQIIPCDAKKNDEPSFLVPHCEVAECKGKSSNAKNFKLQALKNNDTFHDSLENETASQNTGGYCEQPSFLSPQDVGVRRSTRKSSGQPDPDDGKEATEVKLLKSLKRRSGRRSITKEKKRSSLNKSGSKSILEQLKNLKTFIKDKSFEIESGDEPSFLKSDQSLHGPVDTREVSFLTESPCVKKPLPEADLRRETYLADTYKIRGSEHGHDFKQDTFLADPCKVKLLETQKPSEASPRRTTFTVLRKTPSRKSPARSKSEGNKPQHILAALDEALNETEEMSRDGSGTSGPIQQQGDTVQNSKDGRDVADFPRRQFSADSLENNSFEAVFSSPKQLKVENPEVFERRATLTVTKSRPSDALLDQMKKQTANLFKAEDTMETTENNAEVTETIKSATTTVTRTHQSVNNTTFEHSENKDQTNRSEVSFSTTPQQLPTSPNPDHSRRSTHVVKEPRVVNLSRIEQRELFQESLDDSNKENKCPEPVLEVYEANDASRPSDTPANNTRRRLSARCSIKLNEAQAPTSREGKNGEDTPSEQGSPEHKESKNSIARETVKTKENVQTQENAEASENHGLVFIPFDDDKKGGGGSGKIPARPKTVVDPKQFLKKRGNSVPMAMTMENPKRMKKESADVPKKPVVAGAVGPKRIASTGDVPKKSMPGVIEKKTFRATQAAVKETKTVVNTKPVVKQKTGMVKGLAQSKLILLKKSKTALPKHPLPFAAKNMYYDERWMEKQERGFVNWLNFILTPAEEYQGNDVKVKVDAGKLTVDVAKGSVKLAPTNEVLSFRAYSAHRKLNRLRKSACRLFQSESVVKVIQKLEGEVESGRLAVRKDKMLHADIGLKQKILDTLLCYNPLWLRIGIETIYGEVVPLQSNSDVFGLSRFILTRLLTSPDVNQEFAHPTVPHLYRDGYAEATAVHSLKKFLMLVYFLDRAKQERLIDHNPCLFCKNSDVKASKDVLQHFSRDYLSGEGDIIRHLGYLGYKVTYTQTALDEFDFAVSKLSTDLRDGLRLTKVMELMCNKPDLSRTLRVPAISRLQKVHNVEVVFKALAEADINTDSVVARDIVDGHRERTLRLLWNIILHYQVEILLNETQLREEIEILEKSLKMKNQLQKLLKYSKDNKSKRESEGPDLHTQNPRLNLLLKWCRAVCAFYDIKVENFTVSFSDGRALCHIVNYYHPGLLPLGMIKNETSMTHLESMERNTNRSMVSSFNDSFNSSAAFGDTEDPEVYERLLNNEKENFKILFEKVKELGGIPLMLKWSDMSNTIPDEKVVVTYLLYLCARLLDIRHESRAARVIQLAWRKYRLKAVQAEYEVKNNAALKIQKHVKEFLSRRRTEKQQAAALLLQRMWRGCLARKRIQQIKLELLMYKQVQAVKTLQRAVMGYLQRRRYLQTKAAVIQVQAHCRGYLVRKRRFKAACVIQSAMRSYMARRRMHVTRSSIVRIQSSLRGYIARRRLAMYKQAVIVVQRQFRANLAMKECQREYGCRKQACVRIQKCWRDYIARKKQNEIYSAVKIQAAFRGYLEKKRFSQLKCSIIVLQAAVRGYIQRKSYLQQKQAAITIQSFYRNFMEAKLQREKYQELRQTAVFLQARRRMIVQKMKYDTDRHSLIKVQSIIRMFLERRRFFKSKEAVYTIQRSCQMFSCRRKYLISVGAAITLQAGVRGYIVRKVLKQQHRAATILQAFVRKHIEQKKYLILKEAAIKCQRRFRAKIAGQDQLQRYQALRQATVTAQKMFRGQQCRSRYLKDRRKIIKSQGIVRSVLARRSYLKLRNATVVIQRLYRAKKLGEEWRTHLQQLSYAATVIQSGYRGYRVRMEIQQRHTAATCIQSYFRGMMQKQMYNRIKEATILCQRRVRAKQALNHQMAVYRNLKHATTVVQAFVRGWKCRKSYMATRELVVKAQSVCRMVIERRRFLQMKNAAVTLQRHFRAMQLGSMCRQRYEHAKRAAVTLQAAFRGQQVRRAIHRQQSAATCIQKYVRRSIQRKEFLKKKRAVITLQRQFRAKQSRDVCKQQYRCTKQAIITIQAAYRGFKARQEICKQHSAVTSIQKYVRGWLQRKKFLNRRNAVVVLQRRFRAKQIANMCRQRFYNTKLAAITIQAAFRGYQARRNLRRQNMAAVCIQKHVKGYSQRKQFSQLKSQISAACVLQTRWRAMAQGRVDRKAFIELKSSVIIIQRHFRATLESVQARETYLKTKQSVVFIQSVIRGFLERRHYQHQRQAAIKIQAVYRGHICRKSYIALRKATVTCQRLRRAKVKGHREQQKYLAMRDSALKIQSRFRTIVCQRQFQTFRVAAIKIQAVYRGYIRRKSYIALRKATVTCQRLRRATVKGHREQQKYLAMRDSALKIQSRFRAFVCQRQFQTFRVAAIKIQAVYRGYICRKSYIALRKAAITCQRLRRATVKGHREQQKYLAMRDSALKIQSRFRAFVCQRQFQTFRVAAIKIQARYRGYRDLNTYRRLRNAVVVLQNHWQAESLCRQEWLKYRTLRDAAMFVQRSYRTRVLRENYLNMKQAAITIQSNIRMWKARQQLAVLRQQRESERQGLLDRVVRATQIHLSAVKIQRFYRQYRVMKVAYEQLHSVTLIQRWMRSKLQRIHYLRDRAKILCLQRHVRMWFVRRCAAATVIQRAVRCWMLTFEERRKRRAANKIQALWRGYKIRRASTSKKLATARKRVLEANASATEEKKLCNRTTSALDFLLRYKQMSYVLEALRHLDVATRLSWSCCEKMVEANAVSVLYKLLRSCNRSLPHMEIVKVTVDIMLNLAKYEKTRMSLYEVEDCFPALVELLQIYREKHGTIFIKTCTLMGIMSMDLPCKTAILADKKLTDKLQSFHKLTARKHKLEENQRVTRAKMNATFNSTFVVRSPVKKHKIKPDWALHRDKMKDIENPLKAINFLLTNLGLAIK